MKLLVHIFSIALILFTTALLPLSSASADSQGKAPAITRTLEAESKVITQHTTKVNGTSFAYTATTGTQPVWDDKDRVIASLHYTYYTRDKVKDRASRPLLISFNGGPGSASVWMHLAYTGPKVINVDDEGYPLQPYGVKSNPYSVLDVSDILYVNPVNTGFSRIVSADGQAPLTEPEKQKLFFGVNADIKYLAEWINTFVSRHNRWQSPKYLIGESYGTTRVAGLALELQNRQWMYLNGVILVSPTDIGIERDGPVKAANRLPYFAATAWHHKVLDPQYQAQPLEQFVEEVEQFTINELIPALALGGFIEPQQKDQIATRMAQYSGLSKQQILDNNLDVSNQYFWKNLLKGDRKTLGRLDSRYLGIDKRNSGDRQDYWPELTSWLHSFTPAINYYLREQLNYKTDVKYNMFGNVHPWDRSNNNSGEQLRQAMAQNPYLNVMIQAGYFDGATNYFDAKYTMWQLDPSGLMKSRLRFEGYRSGHMMYLRRDDLKTSNQHIREFINATIPAADEPARYPR
ncbi:carboxypeptidase [Thalassotalea ponticola]|uniref:S10 family peptidase n=1 Tax=Thalassotalea ponticola TaxID=1523392 RepID=UPI0025B2A80C|nr:carboxypeptidase [Thalassotalea ponticola]MDN3652782.1 carboxypeptidase [Thalassotalea ponticola]